MNSLRFSSDLLFLKSAPSVVGKSTPKKSGPAVVKTEVRIVRSRRRQGLREVAFEGAGEQAVQHAVGDAPS